MYRMVPLIGLLAVGHYSEDLAILAKESLLPMIVANGGKLPHLNLEKVSGVAGIMSWTMCITCAIVSVGGIIMNCDAKGKAAIDHKDAPELLAQLPMFNKFWMGTGALTALSLLSWVMTP